MRFQNAAVNQHLGLTQRHRESIWISLERTHQTPPGFALKSLPSTSNVNRSLPSRSSTPRQTMVHERHLESLEFGAASDSVAPNDTVAVRVAQRATCKTTRRGRFSSQKLRYHVGCLCAALQLQVPPFRQVNRSRTCAPVTANLSCCAGKRAVCRCDLTAQ